jgi:hypothetical protein
MLNQPLPTLSKEVFTILASVPTQPCSPALCDSAAMLDDWICLNSSTLRVF